MKRKIQLAAWLYSLSIFELKVRGKLAKARNQFIKTASAEYLKYEQIPAWVVPEHQRQLNNILLAHYQIVAPHFGKMTMKQINQGKKATDLFFSFMLEWMRTEALRKSRMIADTDRQDIQDAIVKGIDAGEGISVIASNIKKVSELTTYRASTIARTETNSAATFGAVETARNAEQELGINILKKWLPTNDNRTRLSHKNMINELAIPLNEKFNVDGELLDRPCDPVGSAGNVINCRCAIIFEEAQ